MPLDVQYSMCPIVYKVWHTTKKSRVRFRTLALGTMSTAIQLISPLVVRIAHRADGSKPNAQGLTAGISPEVLESMRMLVGTVLGGMGSR